MKNGKWKLTNGNCSPFRSNAKRPLTSSYNLHYYIHRLSRIWNRNSRIAAIRRTLRRVRSDRGNLAGNLFGDAVHLRAHSWQILRSSWAQTGSPGQFDWHLDRIPDHGPCASDAGRVFATGTSPDARLAFHRSDHRRDK